MTQITTDKRGAELILFIDARNDQERDILQTFCPPSSTLICTARRCNPDEKAAIEIRKEIL
ncbi:MAG TPA: hypothetical protein VMW50_03765 [Dehalococcoidia bacterium]|nr:hypothetical protein [Dehalococcoidia bacterium]